MKKIRDDMLDEYIENLAFQQIFADGLMITDEKGIVRCFRQYRKDVAFFSPGEVVGMHILEVYPDVKLEESTLLRALLGKPTISQLTSQTAYNGQNCSLLESTFPIRKNGKIIGSISFAKYTNYFRKELTFYERRQDQRNGLYIASDMIGASPLMQRLRKQIHQTARTNSAVLICGETGTGKEMVAQSIHSEGRRRDKVFLSQNCSAIPANLLESLLFGTTRGSYTGAVDRPGIFETANGGAIFLDEINSMEPGMQAKLLKVLEEKKVTRIGSGKAIPVDVRILSAINEDPQTCVASGHLRRDLFYRLSAVIIEVPALRDRKEDVLPLAQYYINVYNEEMGKSIVGLTREAERFFCEYGWPGNVRELKNVIEGAFNFVMEREIGIHHLPSYLIKAGKGTEAAPSGEGFSLLGTSLAPLRLEEKKQGAVRTQSLTEAVERFEKQFILAEMKKAAGLSRLARRLGISRQSLSYKLKKHGIELPQEG